MLIYDAVVLFLKTAVIPESLFGVEWWNNAFIIISLILTMILFYVSLIRPFILFIKYGMFGGSKINFLEKD